MVPAATRRSETACGRAGGQRGLFPLDRESARLRAEEGALMAQKYRLLLVDDELSIRKVIGERLKSKGFDVILDSLRFLEGDVKK